VGRELLARLHAVVEAQGSPPIFVSRERDRLTFLSDTGEFMLQSRVAEALMTICGHDAWTRCFRSD
jgi:hypothetical protein